VTASGSARARFAGPAAIRRSRKAFLEIRRLKAWHGLADSDQSSASCDGKRGITMGPNHVSTMH
jgi:hypothetical protein